MGDNQIAVIDRRAQEVVRIIALPGQPRPVALTADGRFAPVVLAFRTPVQ